MLRNRRWSWWQIVSIFAIILVWVSNLPVLLAAAMLINIWIEFSKTKVLTKSNPKSPCIAN